MLSTLEQIQSGEHWVIDATSNSPIRPSQEISISTNLGLSVLNVTSDRHHNHEIEKPKHIPGHYKNVAPWKRTQITRVFSPLRTAPQTMRRYAGQT